MGKLVYFGAYGRAESIRILLSQAKVEFEDERIPFEDWPARKSEFPVGQVPVWVENGVQYNQSCAILRMLGKRHGFYASEPEKMWAIDCALDTVSENASKINRWLKFDAEGHKVFTTVAQNIADFIHKSLHSHEGHFLAGPEMTIADFMAASYIFRIVYNINYPNQEWVK